MEQLQIRKAKQEDLIRVFEIEMQCFAEEAFSFGQFKYLLNYGNTEFVVACWEQTVAAYLVLAKRANSRKLRIYSIAVDENFRGKQIAQALINYAVNYAKQGAYAHITLEVRENNKAAIALYEKNKFAKKGRRTDYYEPGGHATIMWKKID